MGGFRGWLGALGLSVVVRITFLVAALVTGPPALAASPACEETWDRLAHWSEEEATQGLTTSSLVTLQEMIPLLEECSQPETFGHVGMGSDVESWRSLVGVYFDAGDVDRVICLMEKESGGNPGARNRTSGASGLMQVMPSWADVFGYTPDQLFDPTVNLWIASQIREQQGWGAWTPYLRGLCR